MNFANINTGEIRINLDPVLILQDRTITGATLADYQALGWRKVVAVDAPATGYRVTSYAVQAIDATTCKLTVASSVNIADEQAALAAAALAAQKTAAKTILAGTSDETQRALRAFAELTLQEINTLRIKASLPTYTWAQFLTALQAKIDAQA